MRRTVRRWARVSLATGMASLFALGCGDDTSATNTADGAVSSQDARVPPVEAGPVAPSSGTLGASSVNSGAPDVGVPQDSSATASASSSESLPVEAGMVGDGASPMGTNGANGTREAGVPSCIDLASALETYVSADSASEVSFAPLSADASGVGLSDAEPVDAAVATDADVADSGVADSAATDSGGLVSELPDASDSSVVTPASGCFPACLAALQAQCTPELACASTETTVCWDNGVKRHDVGATQNYYANDGSQCLSATTALDLDNYVIHFTWKDGCGGVVATGTQDLLLPTAVAITCTGEASPVNVDLASPGCSAVNAAFFASPECTATDAANCSL